MSDLAKEGNGYLLQLLMRARSDEIKMSTQANAYRQKADYAHAEIEKFEAALREKHPDGANLIHHGWLIRIAAKRDGAWIRYESFETVP